MKSILSIIIALAASAIASPAMRRAEAVDVHQGIGAVISSKTQGKNGLTAYTDEINAVSNPADILGPET